MTHRIKPRAFDTEACLTALSPALEHHADRWRPRPFADIRVPWAPSAPAVARWLQALSHAEIDALEADLYQGRDWPGAVPAELAAWRNEMNALVAVPMMVPAAPLRPCALADPILRFRVPGRKWRQLAGFLEAVLPELPPRSRRIVDWCAGKGHLGRTAGAVTQLPVVCLERQARLGPRALTLARKPGVTLDFVVADVLEPGDWTDRVGRDTALFGLHACGGLTDTLLALGARSEVPVLAVAPCCYHKHHAEVDKLKPRSRLGRAHDIGLTHSALRLATADEVVAPERHRRARRHDNGWRMGMDLLLRDASGRDEYTPLGTFRGDELRGDFRGFAEAVSRRLNLALPARWDSSSAERAGIERARQARGLGVVRGLYRRAVELWIVCDRAHWLTEMGRPASVGRFCEAPVTPRNLMILSVDRP